MPACQVTVDELMEEVDQAVAAQPRTFAEANAERFYQYLGAWKGPLATPESQQEALAFWRSSGEEGVRWLVERLRNEHHVDAMHGAASLLSDLGAVIVDPIFQELGKAPSGDQAQVLLWALVSLAESEPSIRSEGARPELVLAEFLQHNEPDLRESAAGAMRLLRHERALRWLSQRLRDETNAEVRQTIEDELAWHQAR